ncbi:MAG: VOC family protein [Clostridia bacterium]|nr:VOC family protein [Clostridia bacterium]
MRVEHFALFSKNIEKTKEFYEKYFNGKAGEKYIAKDEEFESYFISFESGARLEIMKMPSVVDIDPAYDYTGYSHLAVSVGSKENVDQLTARIKEDGYKVVRGPRNTGDGYYESLVLDPEGNRVEITI